MHVSVFVYCFITFINLFSLDEGDAEASGSGDRDSHVSVPLLAPPPSPMPIVIGRALDAPALAGMGYLLSFFPQNREDIAAVTTVITTMTSRSHGKLILIYYFISVIN